MRPLTEQETKTLFEKLANYTGTSLKNLIAPLDDSPNADRYVFRMQKNRVYYVLLSTANLATSVARDSLLSLGTCLGKLRPEHCTQLLQRKPFLTKTQASSPRAANFVCTSPRFLSSPSTPDGKSGSRATENCLSCTEETSSRLTLAAGRTTAPSTRALLSTT